jgi:SAM-dependent methyltransferase
MRAMDLYHALHEIHRRPACFEEITTADLWTDEHTSSRMLAFHLDGSVDVSSRTTDFIDRSAAWTVSRFGLGPGRSVADFGCGPGLYASRFAAAGATVVGLDFSERSIAYARDAARRQGLSIEYRCSDYLSYEPERRFDLITLIMCDYCALGPGQRSRLLRTFRAGLRPGGTVLLDVYSRAAFDARHETAACARNLDDGFWSPRPYFGFRNTFKYAAEQVVLDKYTIVEEARTRVLYNWLQCFEPEALRQEIENEGLAVEELLGDVAGAAYDPAAPEFAVVVRA